MAIMGALMPLSIRIVDAVREDAEGLAVFEATAEQLAVHLIKVAPRTPQCGALDDLHPPFVHKSAALDDEVARRLLGALLEPSDSFASRR